MLGLAALLGGGILVGVAASAEPDLQTSGSGREASARTPVEARPVDAGPADAELSPDLALYAAVIESVRRGEPYYAAAARELPRHGFETFSPFNWRLPTYAWIAGAFPSTEWVRWLLAALALGGGGTLVRQTARAEGPVAAVVTGWGLVGVLGWLFDGAAHLAQEVWCAVGLTGALALRRSGRPVAASLAELACLFVRELVLPWLAVGLAAAVWRRRWTEALTLLAGLGAWSAFFVWHLARVREFSPPHQTVASGLGAWLAYGGLPFVLQTVRMNALLTSVPTLVVALFDGAALAGLYLLQRRPAASADGAASSTPSPPDREFGRRLLAISVGYQLAFLVVGRPWHLYWGFLYAPILPLGLGALAGRLARRGTGPRAPSSGAA